jgi:hypothetical protein
VREVGHGRVVTNGESIAEPRAERVGGDRGWLFLEDRAHETASCVRFFLSRERQRTPRTRRRPRFLGCSTFPACRGTTSIPDEVPVAL